ncbi:MAG: arsenic resistance protein [Thioalkalivibrionaceae bacterium]
MLSRPSLERHQVWIYLIAIAVGLAVGLAAPGVGPLFDTLLWPVLGALLYVTFVQVPLLHLREAFADLRFVATLVVGNFVLIPLLAFGLMQLLPHDPAIRLGVLLVLLVPCTDWFITFAQLGRGDTARAISVTPLNLLLQFLLLPLYLWMMLPAEQWSSVISIHDLLPAAIGLIGVPLLLAILSERWIDARPGRAVWRDRINWWPVPLLAIVVFLIAAAQVGIVRDSGSALLALLPVFIAFALAAALIAKLLAIVVRLPPASGRTLAFSLGTRNSFVVLPFALSLPAGWEATVVVIVLQSLVELLAMVFYLWWIPERLFRDAPA